MSKTLSDAAISSFDGMVKHAYQDSGKLRECVVQRTGITGSTHRFNNIGKGQAQLRGTQTDITPMNLTHTNQTATLVGWVAAEYTDIFDEDATNLDERAELASAIGKAITRRLDQMIIDAAEAASSSLTVSNDVGGTDTDVNPDKIRRVSRLLGQNGVEVGDEKIAFVGSHFAKEALLAEAEITSADYNSVRRLANGEVNNWLGMDFKWIADRDEGGLTKDGSNDRTCFGWAQSSLGLAVGGLDGKTEVNYIPHKTSWLAAQMLRAGSTHIDAGGLVEVTAREAS